MNAQSRYGAALALLLGSYLLGSFDGRVIQFLTDMTYIALLGILILDPKAARWVKAIGLTVVILSALSSVLYLASSPPNQTLGSISAALNAVVVATAIVVVLRRLATHSKITISTVMGAVLAYTLLGFLFAAIYQAIGLSSSTPFFNQGPSPVSDYSYFSFVTLTTLGYGDLTPALEIGKRLIVIEALMGQIMLVVLVARLVSLWGHLSPKAHDAAVGQLKEAVQARREGAATALAAVVSAGQSTNANVDGKTSADPVADTSTPAETSTPEDQSKASDTVGETRSSPGPDDNPENPSEKSSGEQ